MADSVEVQPSLEVQVKGVDLAKVLRNVILWQEQEVSLTQGRVFASFSAVEVSFYSTDGFTAVSDWVAYSIPFGDLDFLQNYWLSEDEIDTLLMAAVDSKTGALTIHLSPESILIGYAVEPKYEDPEKAKDPENLKEIGKTLVDGSVFLGESGVIPEWVDALEEALEEAEGNSHMGEAQHSFAMRPERLVKFFRVRADKEAPVDMRLLAPLNTRAGPMAAIKIGHTFRALTNFVNREVAKENLKPEHMVFLW